MAALLTEVRAACAEALHVAGRFQAAAAEFARLADEGHEPGESALKAAIAAFAAGETADAVRLLERARRDGASAADIDYVRAQALWAAGIRDRARDVLARAGVEGADGPARNTLAVYLARDGRVDEATAAWRSLTAGDPVDPHAAANLVATTGDELDVAAAADLTRRAVAAARHRHEPYVAWGRLLRRRGQDAASGLALARARLRDGPPQLAAAAPDRPAPQRSAAGRVDGTLGPGGVDLDVTVTVDAATWAACAPLVPTVNPGCGLTVDEDWTPDGRGVRRLRARVTGRPTGPATRFEGGEIELGDASAWLPVVPGLPIVWDHHVRPAPGAVDVPLPGGRRGGLGWCRLPSPSAVRLPDGTAAVGHASETDLRDLAAVASTVAAVLARELGGTPPSPSTVVVVPRPGSTFCYARDGVVRVASGAVDRGVAAALVAHEVGHWWWGVGTRFAPDSEWLAEALAEHAVHLVARDGLLADHRARSWAALAALPGGPPATSLAGLASRSDRLWASALRVKGAAVVAMLGDVVGPDVLGETLRRCRSLGESHVLDAFTFFAIASMLHGASLDWFVRQWVEGDAVLDVRASATATLVAGAWDVTVTAECASVAVPGAPVVIEVRTATGASARLALDVDAVPATGRCTVADRPVELVVDPSVRLYRTPSLPVAVEVRDGPA
jgi:hypothetical protein